MSTAEPHSLGILGNLRVELWAKAEVQAIGIYNRRAWMSMLVDVWVKILGIRQVSTVERIYMSSGVRYTWA